MEVKGDGVPNLSYFTNISAYPCGLLQINRNVYKCLRDSIRLSLFFSQFEDWNFTLL